MCDKTVPVDNHKNTSFKKSLLLVVPVYNEEKLIEKNVETLYHFLTKNEINFKLIIAVSPSDDNSEEIVGKLRDKFTNLEVIIENIKKGRGFSVRNTWKLYDFDIYAFIDADLATGVNVIAEAYELMINDAADLVTASRYLEGSVVNRPPLRRLISIQYNRILRLVFKNNIRDYQCGFKAINKKAKTLILDKTQINSWAWDTELLIIAYRLGLRIKEIPITWNEYKYVHTPLKRLFKDILIHGWGILKLINEVKKLETEF